MKPAGKRLFPWASLGLLSVVVPFTQKSSYQCCPWPEQEGPAFCFVLSGPRSAHPSKGQGAHRTKSSCPPGTHPALPLECSPSPWDHRTPCPNDLSFQGLCVPSPDDPPKSGPCCTPRPEKRLKSGCFHGHIDGVETISFQPQVGDKRAGQVFVWLFILESEQNVVYSENCNNKKSRNKKGEQQENLAKVNSLQKEQSLGSGPLTCTGLFQSSFFSQPSKISFLYLIFILYYFP